MLDQPRAIQVGEADWLVLNRVGDPRYVIHYGPAVHRITGETHMLYRVDHWVLRKADRWLLGYYATHLDAVAAATADLDRPTQDEAHRGGPEGWRADRHEADTSE